MLYTLIAKRFTPDGMVCDKRVHTNLTYEECRKLHQRYSPKLTGYWSAVRSFAEDPTYPDHDEIGEGQIK